MDVRAISQTASIPRPQVAFQGGKAAVASAFIPGAGQVVNGETKKGLKQLGAFTALVLVSGALTSAILRKNPEKFAELVLKDGKIINLLNGKNLVNYTKDVYKLYFQTAPKLFTASLVASTAALGVKVSSIVDAFKNNKIK